MERRGAALFGELFVGLGCGSCCCLSKSIDVALRIIAQCPFV
jgi:hypothetical protein